jgi:hypothetical protein
VKRKIGAAARARKEERYRAAFRKAVLAYLDFAPRHAALAKKIADGVVRLACPVGSGTVARTGKLPLEERVRLAVRAYVRHRYTDYEEDLAVEGDLRLADLDADTYRDAKAAANRDAEEFIERHR